MGDTNRLSYDGSDRFELRIGQELHTLGEHIAAAFGGNCVAVVLGGGYGRGEGACVVIDGTEYPYNDFDLFVVTKRSMHIPDSTQTLRHTYEQRLNVEVDIGKPIPLHAVQRLPHTLMWQDLFDAHKVIFGDPDVLLSRKPSYMDEPLPAVEAIRLLLNRGAGLLQAIISSYRMQQDAQQSPPDADFIRRNYQKCALALGDALLIVNGVYRPPLALRLEAVGHLTRNLTLPQTDQIVESYRVAAEFKIHPGKEEIQPNLSTLHHMAQYWQQIFIHTEEVRTQSRWMTMKSYAQDRFIREVQQHGPLLNGRNLVKQWRLGRLSWRYPREELYGKLGMLLHEILPDDAAWQASATEFFRVWNTCN